MKDHRVDKGMYRILGEHEAGMTVQDVIEMLFQFPMDAVVVLPTCDEVGSCTTEACGIEWSNDGEVVILD